MKTTWITFHCEDGVELRGGLYSPEQPTEKAVVHIHGLGGNFYENDFLQNLSQSYLTESRTDELIPEGTHGGYLLRAKVYNEQYHEGCEQDIFCYRYPELNQVVSLFKCPLLVAFGSRDLILQKPEEVFETFFSSNKNIQTAVIDGANHSYSGKETELADTVCRFICQ